MSYQPSRSRPGSALAALLILALLLWVLIEGLSVHVPALVSAGLRTFDVAPLPPPPPPVRERPRPVRAPRAKEKAAPPGLRARPTDLFLPPPIVLPPLPPVPVIVAPVPGPGTAAHAGNSDRAGPGPGAGGEGDGAGGGGSGGDGDGDTPPHHRSGRLGIGDYPGGADQLVGERTVGVRYTVDVRGRVPACEVTRSSGVPALDAVTCRLIEKRFRFDPGRDAAGHPFAATIEETHSWARDDRPGSPDDDQ